MFHSHKILAHWKAALFLLTVALFGCHSPDGPVEQLMEDLKDEYSITREQAAKKLGNLGKQAIQAIPALQKALLDSHKNVRRNVAEALGKIGPPASGAVELLANRLWDKEEMVRSKAAWALGRIGVKSFPTLKRLIRGKYPHARYYAVLALRQLGGVSAPLLQNAVKDPSKKVRRAAVESLLMLGSKHLSIVLGLLQDKSENIRSFVAWKISTMAPKIVQQQPKQIPNLVKALRGAIQDESNKVRMYASFAMGKMGVHAAQAMDALVLALQDKEWYIRKNAASALGTIGPRARKSIPALVLALKDRTWDVKNEAIRALRRIDERLAVKAMLPLLRLKHWRLRKFLAQTMGWIGHKASASAFTLRLMLSDPVRDVRLAARTSLSKIGPASLPHLRKSLRSRSARVRKLAAQTLGLMGKQGSGLLFALKRLRRDRDFQVRLAAATAMGRIQPLTSSQVKALQEKLVRGTKRAKRKAALALGMGGKVAAMAIPALLQAVQSKDPSLRKQAIVSLGWLGRPTHPDVLTRFLRMFSSESKRSMKRELAVALSRLIPSLNDQSIAFLKQLEESRDTVLQRAYVALMSRLLTNSKALFVLVSSLSQLSPRVATEALTAIHRLGPPLLTSMSATLLDAKLNTPLRKLLSHRKAKVREQAIKVLGNFGFKSISAVPDLEKKLRDSDVKVRRAAASALGWMGSKAHRVIPSLVRALRDRDAKVRRNAVFAMSRMGKHAVKPMTKGLLSTRNPNVLRSLCLAMGRVWLPAKKKRAVVESLRILLLDKKLPKAVLEEAKHAIRRLQSSDQPNVFWVDHPRSPTLEVYSPGILFPNGR